MSELLTRISKEPIDDDMVLAMVNNKPYLFVEARVDRKSVPEGLYMYEIADAESDGKMWRAANEIRVDFLGTIIGKDELPMENRIKSFHPMYYMRKGPSLEDALEEYKKTLPDSLSEAEYFKACDIFEDNFMPDDSDPDFVEYGEEFDGIDDYLLRYDELLAEYSDSSRS